MSARKILFFIIIIVSLLIINNLTHSIYSLWQKKHLVVDARLELEKQQKENEAIMAKPGDGIVVVSQKDLEASSSAKIKPPDTRPNWKKWWDLFF